MTVQSKTTANDLEVNIGQNETFFQPLTVYACPNDAEHRGHTELSREDGDYRMSRGWLLVATAFGIEGLHKALDNEEHEVGAMRCARFRRLNRVLPSCRRCSPNTAD